MFRTLCTFLIFSISLLAQVTQIPGGGGGGGGGDATKTAIQSNAYISCVDSTNTNTYSCTTTPPFTVVNGACVELLVANANTVLNPTLNVNGAGAWRLLSRSVDAQFTQGSIAGGFAPNRFCAGPGEGTISDPPAGWYMDAPEKRVSVYELQDFKVTPGGELLPPDTYFEVIGGNCRNLDGSVTEIGPFQVTLSGTSSAGSIWAFLDECTVFLYHNLDATLTVDYGTVTVVGGQTGFPNDGQYRLWELSVAANIPTLNFDYRSFGVRYDIPWRQVAQVESLQVGNYLNCSDVTNTNAYVCNTTPTFTPLAGSCVFLYVQNGSDKAAPTVNVNGIGPIGVFPRGGWGRSKFNTVVGWQKICGINDGSPDNAVDFWEIQSPLNGNNFRDVADFSIYAGGDQLSPNSFFNISGGNCRLADQSVLELDGVGLSLSGTSGTGSVFVWLDDCVQHIGHNLPTTFTIDWGTATIDTGITAMPTGATIIPLGVINVVANVPSLASDLRLFAIPPASGTTYVAGPSGALTLTGNAFDADALYVPNLQGTNVWPGSNNFTTGTFTAPVRLATPASSSAPCTQGDMAADATHLFMCVATNTWKRLAWVSF